MRHRITALIGAVLAGAMVSAVWQSPAVADEPGFSVTVEAPDEFTAGGNTKTITAVVTSQNQQCRKVRWALLVRTAIAPEQIQVTRIEDDGEFAVTTSTENVTTRFLDEEVDPGLLCRGRTVTGRWQVSFAGPDADGVQFEAQAFDVRDRLLSTAGSAAEIEGGSPPSEEPEPSEEAEPAAPEEEADATEPPAAGRTDESENAEAALVSEETSLLGPGLIVGGVFVFLGLLLLLRIRVRAREARRRAQAIPTGFYTMPRSSR
jgi:hypothetical protein